MIPGTVIGLQGQSGTLGVFNAHYGTANGASTFSFPSSNIGAPDTGRIIVITVNYWEYDTSVNLNSITVGGVSLTQRAVRSGTYYGASGSLGYAAIWSGVVPTGSTASINLSFARTIERGCEIGVWSIYNATSSTPASTTTSSGSGNNAVSLSINVQPNDFGVITASGFYGTSSSFAYTNADERYDIARELGGVPDYTFARSGADFTATSTQTPRTVTVTPSGLDAGSVACMAIWR